jgi:hypothetical protein
MVPGFTGLSLSAEAAGLQPLHTWLDQVTEPGTYLSGLIELAGALANAGRIIDGLATVEAAIEQSEVGWITPELLRLKGELLLIQGTAIGVETAAHQLLDDLTFAEHC